MMYQPIPLHMDQRAYFFDLGIRFTCRQCGACCVGAPGTIFVSPAETVTIGRHLGMGADDFMRQYCYAFKQGYSINEDSQGQCLVFENGCSIYPVRPLQCRTFPFWFSNMRSMDRWRRIERRCPGIGTGRHYTREEILSIIQSTLHI